MCQKIDNCESKQLQIDLMQVSINGLVATVNLQNSMLEYYQMILRELIGTELPE